MWKSNGDDDQARLLFLDPVCQCEGGHLGRDDAADRRELGLRLVRAERNEEDHDRDVFRRTARFPGEDESRFGQVGLGRCRQRRRQRRRRPV